MDRITMIRGTNANTAHVINYDSRKLKQLKRTKGLHQNFIKLTPSGVAHSETPLAKDIIRISNGITSNKAESIDLAAIKELLSGDKDPPKAQPTRPAIDPEPGDNNLKVDGAAIIDILVIRKSTVQFGANTAYMQ